MKNYREIEGDLIKLALEGKFDAITHGANCFCQMGAGIAPQMAKAFDAQNELIYDLESLQYKGDVNKLGQIQVGYYNLKDDSLCNKLLDNEKDTTLAVINSYTQYNYGKNHNHGVANPLDYEALTLCMRKINHQFKGKHIGLPKIGCGLAGGNWTTVRQIIQKELVDCKVSVVIYVK